MDNIEKVVYINLEHRTDRKQQIERELSVFPSEKVIRFQAVYEKGRGHLGCSKSHIAVLEMAIQNRWKNVLIVEDDMVWNHFESGMATLKQILAKNPDVIMLGGYGVSMVTGTYKVTKANTTVAYLVFNNYYQTLLDNFKEGAHLLDKNYEHLTPYAIDQYWHKLQEKDNWYIIYPGLCEQREGYSDIEQKSVIRKPFTFGNRTSGVLSRILRR
jgi:glycosyl transferase family 25